jgi:hypothetical protein
MRSVLGILLLVAAAGAAWGQETVPPAETTPTTTAPTPVPPPAVAPAPAKEYGRFDAGLRFEFYAEPNLYRAYLTNPADFIYFEENFVAGDVGGDLSFGGFNYSRNRGGSGPGPTEPGEEAGLDLSYTAGLGGRALGAYRRDFWVLGGACEFNRSVASFAYNGAALAVDPFFTFDAGWNNVDLASQKYSLTAAGAASFEPHVVGGRFTFAPERLEGDYDYELLPPEGETGRHRVEELWGRREVKAYDVRAGYAFRPGEKYDLGGAFGVRVLRSSLDWRDETAEEENAETTEQGTTGALDLEGLGFAVDGGGRYLLLDNLRVGGALTMQFTPGITFDWRGERWDLAGPFGERTAEDYRLAEADERRYRFGGGVAFYPDERTTLALDYTYDRLTVAADVYDDAGALADELTFAAYHTYTRLGVERWFTDDVAGKIGWEHNLFSYPRNVFFGGVAYKFDEAWFLNYDYRGGHITINNLSLFVPFDDVVKPASHRFTVAWSF